MVKSGLSLSKPRMRKNEIIDLGSSGYYLIVFSYLRAPKVFSTYGLTVGEWDARK